MRRLALVTGASSGIGAAFARALAARGDDVALVARREDRLAVLAGALAAKHGIEAIPVPCDLAEPGAAGRVLVALAARGRTVEVLVNNAGFSVPQRFVASTWAAQQAFLTVQIMAATELVHAVLPGMLEAGYGRIINVSSVVAFSPGAPGHTLYPAAKSYLLKMSQSLAAEVAAHGVHVTALCPGQTESEFAEANGTAGLVRRAGFLTQSAEVVVAAGLRANEAGREVVISGWNNWLAAAAMTLLPDGLVARIIRPVAAKFALPG